MSSLVKTYTTTERIGGKETYDQALDANKDMFFHVSVLLKEACAIPPEDEDEGKVNGLREEREVEMSPSFLAV